MNEYVTFDRETEDYLNDLCRREALIEYFKRYSGVSDQEIVADFETSVWNLSTEAAFELYMDCFKRFGVIVF